jgi:quercetin dioxygenase-like cupin family protein
MNIKEKHQLDKSVSAQSLFKGEGGAIALQILKDGHLKEHITKVPALLICIEGDVVFENEKGLKETLHTGDYVHIDAHVKHWVDGLEDSQLILIK